MEGDEVQTFGIEPKIWTMTTMSLAEKKSKFREMELKHEVNCIFSSVVKKLRLDSRKSP